MCEAHRGLLLLLHKRRLPHPATLRRRLTGWSGSHVTRPWIMAGLVRTVRRDLQGTVVCKNSFSGVGAAECADCLSDRPWAPEKETDESACILQPDSLMITGFCDVLDHLEGRWDPVEPDGTGRFTYGKAGINWGLVWDSSYFGWLFETATQTMGARPSTDEASPSGAKCGI